MTGRLPRQGEAVIFIPRVPYGRQDKITALVTRVWDAEKGDIDLICFAADNEPMRMQHVAMRGGATQKHCWEFVGDGPLARIAELETRCDQLHADIVRIEAVKALQGRPAAAPAGKPRK